MLEGESLQAALEEIQPQAIQATLFRCVSLEGLAFAEHGALQAPKHP
jgi:hypothetical protein